MKYLAIPTILGLDRDAKLAFEKASKNFTFVKDGLGNYSYVYAHCIITNGIDIIYYKYRSKINIAFSAKVERSAGKTLDEHAIASIKKHIKSTFSDIFIINSIEKKYSIIDDLTGLNIVPTKCGIYNSTKRKFIPIYFVMIDRAITAAFINSDKKRKFECASFPELMSNFNRVNFDTVSREILSLIKYGKIILPMENE